MNKKIFISCLCLGFLATTFAQETDTKKSKTEKKTKKVIVIDNKKNEEVIIDDNDDDKNKKEKKVKVFVKGDKKSYDKKVKVTVNGEEINADEEGDEKKVIVTVDGDKVTINGKPVEDMNDTEIDVLKGKTDHLKLIAPYLRRSGNVRRFNMDAPTAPMDLENMDFFIDKAMSEMPINKALLGVITEKDEKGAKINNVSKESAAEKAGLQKDDIITKVNDDEIKSSDDLTKAIGKYNPDDKVKVTYIRDGKTKTTEAALLKNNVKISRAFSWNSDDAAPFEIAPFNKKFNLGDDNHFGPTRPKIGFKVQDTEDESGFKILEVEPESPAAKAGLQSGDIVTNFEDVKLKGVKDFDSRTALHKPGNILKITYLRNGVSYNTEIKFPKKLVTADL